ncbi:hydroxyisourate hydrolase [Shewanella sp.]|uniref:hydroxyisourate hydrolase n=1 Tax=Shewanella sp. TaxID=50422 RepID=UPI003A978444
MGKLTTHILDTTCGKAASNVVIRLYKIDQQTAKTLVSETRTNADGRCDAPLLEGAGFISGNYELEFDIGDYFAARAVTLDTPRFLDTVVLRVGLDQQQAHYHIPLLVSPYSYSTYRGS